MQIEAVEPTRSILAVRLKQNLDLNLVGTITRLMLFGKLLNSLALNFLSCKIDLTGVW